MAKAGYTASGRKIKKTTKYTVSKSRSSTPSSKDIAKYAPKSKVASAQAAASRERSGTTATSQSSVNPFEQTFQATKGATSQAPKQGFLSTLGKNIKTGVKASLGLGEAKKYDPDTVLGKAGSALEEANRMRVPMALMGGISATDTIGRLTLAAGKGVMLGRPFNTVRQLPATQITRAVTIAKPINLVKQTKILKTLFNGVKIGGKAINTKTVKIANTIVAKGFDAKKYFRVGNMLKAAAGSMVIGLWAQKEAPEPISMAMDDIAWQSRESGDWTLYEEAQEARDELLLSNQKMWEKVALFSPLSPIIGIPNALKGAIKNAQLLDQWAENEKLAQETGQTNEEKRLAQKQQEADMYKDNTDYHLEQKALYDANKIIAENADMKSDAAFWADQRDKERDAQEADRIAIAQFWLEYRKLLLKISEESRPATLKFGLL